MVAGVVWGAPSIVKMEGNVEGGQTLWRAVEGAQPANLQLFKRDWAIGLALVGLPLVCGGVVHEPCLNGHVCQTEKRSKRSCHRRSDCVSEHFSWNTHREF